MAVTATVQNSRGWRPLLRNGRNAPNHSHGAELAGSARAAEHRSIEAAGEIDGFFVGLGHTVLALAALADGDVVAAQEASEMAWQHMSVQPQLAAAQRAFNQTEVALAKGDLATARRLADEAVSAGIGWHLATAMTARARVAMAEGRLDDAERDVYDGLASTADVGAYLALPGILECLAALAGADEGRRPEAARLFGAAEAFRQRTGAVRFRVHPATYESWVATLRDAMPANDFEAAWAEGAALSTEEAIAYAQRGRGERKRPSIGWASPTPAELDVVRLVAEGLTNKDVAARLFVSPRTVQAHLAHVFAKIGVTTRTQLAQEAARRAPSDAS